MRERTSAYLLGGPRWGALCLGWIVAGWFVFLQVPLGIAGLAGVATFLVQWVIWGRGRAGRPADVRKDVT
jgi:hypothetical protein